MTAVLLVLKLFMLTVWFMMWSLRLVNNRTPDEHWLKVWVDPDYYDKRQDRSNY